MPIQAKMVPTMENLEKKYRNIVLTTSESRGCRYKTVSRYQPFRALIAYPVRK